jgi:hypothetical protein
LVGAWVGVVALRAAFVRFNHLRTNHDLAADRPLRRLLLVGLPLGVVVLVLASQNVEPTLEELRAKRQRAAADPATVRRATDFLAGDGEPTLGEMVRQRMQGQTPTPATRPDDGG